MDIQEQLTAFAMLGATWVMWLLVGLSVLSLTVVFERAFYLFSSNDDVSKLAQDLTRLLAKGDVEGAIKRVKSSRSIEAQVALAGLEAHGDGPKAAAALMSSQTTVAKLGMDRYLSFLGTVGNNAPFVGLAGTVIGIIKSFQEMVNSQGQVSPQLMAEIGEALVATLIGLLVALPAVAFFNFFRSIIKTRVSRAEALSGIVVAHLEANHERASDAEGDA